jgi:hypothetical protein
MAELPKKFLDIGAVHISSFNTLGGLNHLSQLAAQRTRASEQDKKSFQSRKLHWLAHVRELYDTVEGFLAELIANGVVTVSRSAITLNEEHVGEYEAPLLSLIFGDSVVKFQPKGTLVIGGFGRVDVVGPGGKGLVILEEDIPSDTPFEEKKLIWKIVLRKASVYRLELSADNVADVISNVM